MYQLVTVCLGTLVGRRRGMAHAHAKCHKGLLERLQQQCHAKLAFLEPAE
jgi:hypothetical protein